MTYVFDWMIILRSEGMDFLVSMMHLVEPVKYGMVKSPMGPVGEEVLNEVHNHQMENRLFNGGEARKPTFGAAIVNYQGMNNKSVGSTD